MDASYDLILAAVTRLRETPEVAGFVANRIFDRVPERQDGSPNVTYPYISIGPSTSIPDDYDCIVGEEVTIQFDVWSSGAGEAFGTVECRKICGAVKRALHDTDLALTANALASLQLVLMRVIDDPNPAINHGVVQFTGMVETT